MGKNKLTWLLAKSLFFVFLFWLPACLSAFTPPKTTYLTEGSTLLDTLVQEITTELVTVSPREFSPGQKLLVTTFVELNNLKKTSAFGRLISERLMTKMSDLGFSVVEIRRSHNIYVIEKKGEMILTRKNVPDTISSGAILYGTYLASKREVLVTARIVRASDFQILKSWNGKIAKTPFIANLIGEDKFDKSGVYEYLNNSPGKK